MIIKHARLLAQLSEGFASDSADIRIEGERIAEISAIPLMAQPDEIVLDAAGKTVLPGLLDIHLHFSVSGNDLNEDNAKTVPQRTLEAYSFALKTLQAGFTTVRDVGDVDSAGIVIRDAVEAGRLIGPRIKASGRILTPTEAGNQYFAGMYDECNSPDEVRGACRRRFKEGSDFIKVMASGAISNPSGVPGMTIETEEELREMVHCANMRGTYVAAHCHGAESVALCMRTGVRCIEHGTILSDAIIEELKKENSYIIPTLLCTTRMQQTTAKFADFMVKKLDGIVEQRDYWLKKAYKAGIKLGFGTDAGTTDNWHGENAQEFIERHRLIGMKPIDILCQATCNSAEIIG
ncbi:MAG: amidohydrolase family protein, partial [Kiritimatiellia bacterium]